MIPDAVFRSARLAAGAFFMAVLCGFASMVPQTVALREAWPEGVPKRVENQTVPFFPQDEYQCGPSALATVLMNSGVEVYPEDLVKAVYIPERQGSLQAEMLAAPRQFGRVGYRLEPRYSDLLREVAAGNPVVILQDLGPGPIQKWHYAVVVGYDYPEGELYLRSGQHMREAMPFTMLEYTWKTSNYWAMVALPPDRVPVTANQEAYLSAITAMERVGDKPSVLAAYKAALERWPDSLGASVGLANQQHALGQLKEAEAVLRSAAQRHPDSVVVLNNLAQTLSDQGRNPEALALIEKASARTQREPPLGPAVAAAIADTRALIVQRMEKTKRR